MARKAGREVKKVAYHHGDLERALVETAVRLIHEDGVAALTLRRVGARLGVSRTALYRHFDGKQALLARVASEGFKRFHDALSAAAARARARRADPLRAMADAYIKFARSNPSHYQTMFSGVLTDHRSDSDLQKHGDAAFNVLLDAIREGQAVGRIRAGDPVELAEITWALSHGITSLAMAGQLPQGPAADRLAVRAWTMLEQGLARK